MTQTETSTVKCTVVRQVLTVKYGNWEPGQKIDLPEHDAIRYIRIGYVDGPKALTESVRNRAGDDRSTPTPMRVSTKPGEQVLPDGVGIPAGGTLIHAPDGPGDGTPPMRAEG